MNTCELNNMHLPQMGEIKTGIGVKYVYLIGRGCKWVQRCQKVYVTIVIPTDMKRTPVQSLCMRKTNFY